MENKFDQVVEKFQNLQGISKKTAQRLVMGLINNPNTLKELDEGLLMVKTKLGECSTCFYLTIDGICPICSDSHRNQNQVMVVANMMDAKIVEESKTFNGIYAILKGEIDLNKNITPDKLKIPELLMRVNQNSELIFALNATFNGELTANYLRDIARKNQISYARLARGIPRGGVLDYIDEQTLKEAIRNRHKNDEE